jgi:inner membrane protein
MATLFTHAALPWLALRASKTPVDRKLLAGALLCATVADLDLIGAAFDVRPGDLFGHRGLTHSLVWAGMLAVLGAFALGGRWRHTFLVLFAAGASHGLIDTFTQGEHVALFSPLSLQRFALAWRPVPTSPLGVPEFLSGWGVLVVLNELMLVVAPVALLLRGWSLWRSTTWAPNAGGRLVVAAMAWAGITLALCFTLPELFAPSVVRVIVPLRAAEVAALPTTALPEHQPVTTWPRLQALGLFDRTLTPPRAPWSGGFFPSWFGRESGRWQDSRVTLIGRTLLGARPPTADEARGLSAEQSWGYSPIEKYDLLIGDLAFRSTWESLNTTHNMRPRPRFWHGMCNGVAVAAIERPEPTRVVDAISATGQRVRFHPIDVKALLAISYYFTQDGYELGNPCERIGFDVASTCSMNPALLLLATLNELGRGHRSFLLDVHPTMQVQYYPVVSAKVGVVRAPYPVDSTPMSPALRGKVSALVDVSFEFEMSSTTLPLAVANVPVPGTSPEQYQPVGVRVVPFHWTATIALGPKGELLGGRWTGDPAEGPDTVDFIGEGPELLEGRVLGLNPGVQWAIVDRLARASAGEGPAVVDLSVDAGR